tara:strand:- start:280 stop:666 length:387 start_codon:yes stop_codon:yes gene_type:complete
MAKYCVLCRAIVGKAKTRPRKHATCTSGIACQLGALAELVKHALNLHTTCLCSQRQWVYSFSGACKGWYAVGPHQAKWRAPCKMPSFCPDAALHKTRRGVVTLWQLLDMERAGRVFGVLSRLKALHLF